MANIKSAIKRARQNVKRNALKSSQRASTRTAVKSVLSAIEANDKDTAKEALAAAEKLLIQWLARKLSPKIKPLELNLGYQKKLKHFSLIPNYCDELPLLG